MCPCSARKALLLEVMQGRAQEETRAPDEEWLWQEKKKSEDICSMKGRCQLMGPVQEENEKQGTLVTTEALLPMTVSGGEATDGTRNKSVVKRHSWNSSSDAHQQVSAVRR